MVDKAIREYFEYRDGKIYWKLSPRSGGVKPGDRAGGYEAHGYRSITFKRKKYKEHRVAWFLVYGEWPTMDLDHINRIKDDNRIENLREATLSENTRNRSVSLERVLPVGVYRNGKSFYAQIRLDGVNKYLGTFADPKEAERVFIEAAREVAR